MATEAQVTANRSNAQKSTGPRTPEGKEKASQNALKHGLLAREAVVVGEEPDEFDLYRDQLRADLAPAGMVESLLVERIAGLSWRLQRAERFHTEAFDVLYAQCAADPQVKRRWPDPGPNHADPIVGVTVVQDFSETKVLERLLVYERRIENSLYRTMAELRNLQRLRGQDTAEAVGRVPVRAYLPSCEETPDGVTTNVPEAQGQSCETTPISEEVSRLKCLVPSESCQTDPICGSPFGTGIPSAALSGQALPVNVDHGQDAHATVPPDGGTTNLPEAQSELCETNPICVGPRSTGILPVNLNHGRDGEPKREEMRLGTHAHATVPEAGGQSCETNPIRAGANKSQAGYRPIFRRRR